MPDADIAQERLLTVDGLSKTFGGRGGLVRAVDDVSFTLNRRESLGIVGESGSGKSTLARLVLRLDDPTAGTIDYAGTDLLALRGERLRQMRRRMQMVFQNPYGSLLPGLSVEQNIAEPLRIHRVGNRESQRKRAVELMKLVGLSDRYAGVYPARLSGGQRQRVGIARAIALEPELLICDEPTSALDVSIQAQILSLLEELQERLGFAMIFITHNLAVAERLTDRLMVMHHGTVVESGPTEDVFRNPQDDYTRALLDSVLPVRRPATPSPTLIEETTTA